MEKSITSPAHLALATTLREARLERGMSQQEVAHALGVPQSFVSKYESGHRRLDLVELRLLATVLGITLGAVVDRFENVVGDAT